MKAEPFLDTNVLVYAVTSDDPRAEIAAALMAKGGRISVQVLNEFANIARRTLDWPWSDIVQALGAFRALCSEPLAIGIGTHEAAIDIAERDGISFYDALIVASALEAGCSMLLSEDMQDGRTIAGRLTIRNPFAQA
jgi:predicted nucleic acid-binding protein